jgi:hypothetical protein
MSDTSLCRECGVKLVANAPQGLCQECWLRLALKRAVGRLRTEFVVAGKGELFEVIKIFLTGSRGNISWAQLAASLNLTEAALKMAISRMRRRCAVLIREELAGIAGNPFAITDDQDKWRALLTTVASLPTNRGTFLISPLSALLGEVKDRPNPEDRYSDAWRFHCPHCGCEITAGRKHCCDCEIIVLTEPGNSQVFGEVFKEDSADEPAGAAEERKTFRGTLWTVGGILVAILSYPVMVGNSLGRTNIVALGVILFGALTSVQVLTGNCKDRH